MTDDDDREHIELVCPRCGKTRSLKYSRRRKTPMCQPCAVAVADKRRQAARFMLDDDTTDDRLAELKND
jgi:transposase-like protein